MAVALPLERFVLAFKDLFNLYLQGRTFNRSLVS